MSSSLGSEMMNLRPGVELSIGYRHIGILLHLELDTTANSELWVVQWDTAAIKVVSMDAHDIYACHALT